MSKDNPGKGTTLAWRTCRACGARVLGGPRRWYCDACAAERNREATRLCAARRRAGATRQIGSTDLCAVCGKPYEVNSGRQRYCPVCAPAAVKRVDNAQSRERNAANIILEVKNARRRKGPQECACKICGRSFVAPSSRYAYCSDDCRREGLRASGREADARRRKKP